MQGGSVVRELARSDRAYRVRGLTRDTTKPAAQALTKDGVELYGVTIALDNEAAVKEAFCGADIAFVRSVCHRPLLPSLSGRAARDQLLGAQDQGAGMSRLRPVVRLLTLVHP